MNLDLYEQSRPFMATGDLLLWKTKSALGWLIRLFAGGDVNHAGLVIWFQDYDKERLYTLEALEHGVVLLPLSNRLTALRGECYWCGLRDEFFPFRMMIGYRALSYTGTKYDRFDVLKQIVGRVSTDAKRLFCSEYAVLSWHMAGLPVSVDPAARPGDMEKEFEHIIKPRVRIL